MFDLMTRSTAGLTVTATYVPAIKVAGIVCEMDGRSASVIVDSSKLWDAFEHPCCYLSAAQVAELGVK